MSRAAWGDFARFLLVIDLSIAGLAWLAHTLGA